MFLFLLLGPPGSGKGSLAQRLSSEYNSFHLSTGRIFRNLKNSIINTGNLISDDLVNDLIFEELRKLELEKKYKFVILDGFPRTISQAEFLRKHFSIKKVFFISNIDYEILIKRLSSRVLCVLNDHSFNLINSPPKIEGICDFDGSKLYQREDDKSDVVKKRLDVYHKFTSSLENFYRSEELVEDLDFHGSIDDWFGQVGKYFLEL